MIASIPAGVAEKAWTFVPDYYDCGSRCRKACGARGARSRDPAGRAQRRGSRAEPRLVGSAAANNDGIDLLRSKGMTVAAPAMEVADSLKQIGASMARDWAQRTGNAGQAILGQYHRAESRAEQ